MGYSRGKKREDAYLFLWGFNKHTQHEFQQPINSCIQQQQATGLGLTEFDDIFKSCYASVSYVVNEGMTIGELYDVASSHIFAEGLRTGR